MPNFFSSLKHRPELLGLSLVCLAVVSRWLPHPPNVAPVAAVAIFSGLVFKQKWAMAVPLFALLISDLVIGFYGPTMLAVYGCFGLSVLIGHWASKNQSLIKIIFATLASAVIFFLITNASVWWFGSMYPHSLGGLIQAYVAGLPFFRNSLIGDFMYISILVSLWKMAGQTLSPKKLSQNFSTTSVQLID